MDNFHDDIRHSEAEANAASNQFWNDARKAIERGCEAFNLDTERNKKRPAAYVDAGDHACTVSRKIMENIIPAPGRTGQTPHYVKITITYDPKTRIASSTADQEAKIKALNLKMAGSVESTAKTFVDKLLYPTSPFF